MRAQPLDNASGAQPEPGQDPRPTTPRSRANVDELLRPKVERRLRATLVATAIRFRGALVLTLDPDHLRALARDHHNVAIQVPDAPFP